MSEKSIAEMKTVKSSGENSAVDKKHQHLASFKLSASRLKSRKPLMEKKRRARINDSLETLKEILLKNTVAITQGTRPTKLEKADILEMTVRYLKVLHKRTSPPSLPPTSSTLPSPPITTNINTSESCVTSTTSLQSTSKSKAMVNHLEYFVARDSKMIKIKHRSNNNDKVNKENHRPMSTGLIQSNANPFRMSERSAFRLIPSSNNSKRNDKNCNSVDQSNPWRPWRV